jgi:hypothetical protein
MRFVTVVALLAVASFAWAGTTLDDVGYGHGGDPVEWQPTKDLMIKWMQLPDCDASAVSSEWCEDIGLITDLADDFPCDDPCPIVAIEWWGTWYNCAVPVPPPPPIDFFIVRFYEYLPAPPFSRPGIVLYDEAIYFWEMEVDCDPYDYHYWADLPVPFEQVPGNYYFIQIQCVHIRTDYCQWGWHQCHVDYEWNDESVLKSDYFGVPDWTPLSQLIGYHFEPSFVLYCEANNPVEDTTWSRVTAIYG